MENEPASLRTVDVAAIRAVGWRRGDEPRRHVRRDTSARRAVTAQVYTAASGARYRVVGPLGDPGGFASVHAVEDDAGEHHALKRLRLAGLPSRLLHDEAERLRGIRHPNVIGYRDAGTNPAPFLVMEPADPGGLRALIADARRRRAQLPLDVVLLLTTQLFGGLAAIHRSVVHGDVKAGNVLLCGMVVKVIDLGSARVPGAPDPLARFKPTAAGYRPPEAWLDGPGRLPTAAYDLYGAGAVLFELATLRRPFAGRHEDELRTQHLRMPPPRPRDLRSDLPRDLEDLILRLLRKDPDRRPVGAEQVLREANDIAVHCHAAPAPGC